MPKIKPFEGYIADPAQVAAVVTPAYDAMLPQERRSFAERHPGNYVNVMRTLEEYADDADPPTLEQVLEHNRARLNELLARQAFVETEQAGYYLYKLAVNGHEQVGVIADIRIEEYECGRLRTHENTQVEKEDLLARYLSAVGVTSSPVCVAYQPNESVSAAVRMTMESAPLLHVKSWDDVEQTVWRVCDPGLASQLEQAFESIDVTYLTDGHHRCASGIRHARNQREAGFGDAEAAKHNFLLVALFPADQLRIFSYFRCVRDLNGLTNEAFIAALKDAGFDVASMSGTGEDDLLPSNCADITAFVDGQPYRIRIPEAHIAKDDPVKSLSVSILQDRILNPILGIIDARKDSRLSYMPGVAGVAGIIDRYRDDGWRLGFACFNTTMQEIMDVADAGRVMPPKSTWFDPKLRAGLFLRRC